jgi:hypothetical protein
VAESDEEKATLFTNLLATQNMPAAYLTADDALPQLSFLLPDVYEPLELVNNVGEVQAVVEALTKRKAHGPIATLR